MTTTARLRRRAGVIAVGMALGLGVPVQPAIAQSLSQEGDRAFWCAAAFASLANKQAFASDDQQAAALSDLARFEPSMGAEATQLGWQTSDIEDTARSYYAEVDPQIDDYLQWRDPAALRLSLADCFPSAGL